MSSYVPPHARRARQVVERSRRDYIEQEKAIQQKQEERLQKSIENTEENFPSLSGSRLVTKAWSTGTKTFAQLANEWSEKTVEDALLKPKQDESIHPVQRQSYTLPTFHNVHRFVEPEDEQIEEEEQPHSSNNDDGWVVVARKVRREKTIEEKLNRPETPPTDETVWNADGHPAEHETCWDERY